MNHQPLQDDDAQNSPNDSANLANVQKLLDAMKEQKSPLYWATGISLLSYLKETDPLELYFMDLL